MKKLSFIALCLFISTLNHAQITDSLTQTPNVAQESETKKDGNLKITGYIQTQFQWGEKDAKLKVGDKNTDDTKSFNRIGIRRGRVKFSYEKDIATAVLQLDVTEKGVELKDAYINITEPWLNSNSLKVGAFKRAFGNEVGLSSSSRETTEISNVFQTIFSDTRDLGAMLTLQAPKSSPLHFLKLEAGIFTGNGVNKETDSKKDFSGHLSMNKEILKDFTLGLGVSYFNGSAYLGTENKYVMNNNGFVLETVEEGSFIKREYIGFDGQFTLQTSMGQSQINAEYVFGTQPGSSSSNKSNYSSTLPDYDTYIRKFQGGYINFIQDFNYLPISAVVRYDWYDPNTKISKSNIGNNGTGIGDIAYNTIGFGLLSNFHKNHRITVYYEIIDNEETAALGQLDDNVFTLRYQFKF